jgi:hypothetical protein
VETRIIFQDNLWFRGRPYFWNYRRNGKWMIPVRPKLGLTSSDDAVAKAKELRWVNRHTGERGSGVIIAQEWIRPDNFIDSNLRNPWLPTFEKEAPEGRWCIFYDPVLAARQRGLLKKTDELDFERRKIRRMWESDLDYLERYFAHPQYWRLRDGHPVLYVWAAFALKHVRQAFLSARSRTIYILADTLGTKRRPKQANGLTGFTAALPNLERGFYRLRDLFPLYEKAYRRAAAAERYDFIPAGSCQYDDAVFMKARGEGEMPLQIIAADVEEVEDFLELALSYAEPIDGTRYLFWGTLNNWAEGTTVLPTISRGQRFPGDAIGHYRYAHLRAISRVVFGG